MPSRDCHHSWEVALPSGTYTRNVGLLRRETRPPSAALRRLCAIALCHTDCSLTTRWQTIQGCSHTGRIPLPRPAGSSCRAARQIPAGADSKDPQLDRDRRLRSARKAAVHRSTARGGAARLWIPFWELPEGRRWSGFSKPGTTASKPGPPGPRPIRPRGPAVPATGEDGLPQLLRCVQGNLEP